MGCRNPLVLAALPFFVTFAFSWLGSQVGAVQVGAGAYAPLITISRGEFAGTVFLQESRYFVVQNFRFLEHAPAVWWAVTKDKSALQLSEAVVDESLHLTPQLTVEVSEDVDWDDVAAISLRSVQGGEELAVAHLADDDDDDDDATHSWRGRALMQSGCDSSCSISIGGVSYTYGFCEDVSSRAGFRVLWNQTELAQQATLAMAFEGDAGSGQWAGLGFTSTPDTMIGSTAMVVKDAGEAPSIEQYYLGDETSSAVTPSSNLLVSGTRAGKSGSKLQGAFVLTGNKVVNLASSNSELNVIWAVGPLAASGALNEHLPKGSANLQLAVASTSAAAAPAPGTEQQPELYNMSAAGGEGAAAPESEPDEDDGETTLAPACSLTMNGLVLDFPRCTNVGTGLVLYWHDPAANSLVLQGAITFSGSGWVGVGFPQTPGTMVGASAIIVQTNASAPGGASGDGYYLAATYRAGVQSPAKFALQNLTVNDYNGQLVAVFSIDVTGVVASLSTSVPLITAWGPLTASGDLEKHTRHQAMAVNFATDGLVQTAAIDQSSESDGESTLAKAHAWLMAISCGLLIPIGIGVARNLKFLDPAWFYVHVTVQSLGYSLAVAGFVCGWQEGGTHSEFTLHRWLGVAMMILFSLQMTASFARPHLDSGFRRTWNLFHWWGGRVGLGLAVANIYIGLLQVYQGDTTGYVIAYSVVLGVLVGGFLLMEAVQYARLPPPAALAPRRLAEDVAGQFIGSADVSSAVVAHSSRSNSLARKKSVDRNKGGAPGEIQLLNDNRFNNGNQGPPAM